MDQLPLDLALPPSFARDDFLPAAANREALDLVEAWPAWPDSVCLLCGPHGAGKSHLGTIWAARAEASVLGLADLRQEGWPARIGPATLLDDADRLDGLEAALFHLLNLVREQGVTLLLTASTPPDRWGLQTPDLLSRLRLAPLVRLRAPDDALMRAVLVKLFADRQVLVDESVIGFLVLRLARSLDEARRVVDALDRIALARGRRVTRPMASEVLSSLGLDDEDA